MNSIEVIAKHFRTSMRRINTDNMPVLVRRGDRKILANVFAELNLNNGVEVGTKHGEWAEILCRANPNLKLTCIDPYLAYNGISQERQDRIREHALDRLKNYNVTFSFKPSMEGLKDFEDRSLDFCYVDANHTFDHACMDLICWAYKVRKGGIMAMHDYMAGYRAGVMKATDAYTHCHKIRPWFVTREHLATAFWVV